MSRRSLLAVSVVVLAAAALAACGQAAAARADARQARTFAFVLAGGRVQTHEVDPATGGFRRLGSADAGACTRLSADPSGRWVLCFAAHDVTTFRVGQDGSLEPQGNGSLGRAPWSVPQEIELDPSGRFLWGIDPEEAAPTVWAAAFDAVSGSVRVVEREPAGWRPVDLQRAGRFLYVANRGSGDVWGYAVDAGSGALRALGRMAQLDSPRGLAADPEGRFLYVAGRSIVAFRRAEDGRLSPLGRVAAGQALVVARPVEWARSCTPILSLWLWPSWPTWPSARSRFPPILPPWCGSAAP